MTGKNLLLVRLDNLGDVLLTSPAFRALKQHDPQARLTLLTSHIGAAVAPYLPDIDDVIPFTVPWIKTEGDGLGSQAVFELIEQLKRRNFDAALIFTVFSQNPLPAALLCYLAEIPVRVGYCRENPYQLLTHWLPDTEPFSNIQHEVMRQINLLRALGIETDDTHLSLAVSADQQDRARLRLHQHGIDVTRPWLLLHPGVSESKRRYPVEKFAEAGRELVRQGYQLVITGSAAEQALAEALAQATGGISLAGELALGDLIALIACAPLLIANNTGPVHIAAAVGTPVVVLYAHTNPQHTPWLVPHRILYFDVPPQLRSKNTLLTYTYAQTVPQPVIDATPDDIVRAALDLLSEISSATEKIR